MRQQVAWIIFEGAPLNVDTHLSIDHGFLSKHFPGLSKSINQMADVAK